MKMKESKLFMNFISNFLNKGDSVITYFNGSITQNQLITIIVVVLVCLILLKVVKKGIKLLVFLCALGIIFFNIHNFSPSKLLDTSTLLSSPTVKEQLVTLAEKSEVIKVEDNTISVKVDNEWCSLNDIKSIVTLEDNQISVNVNGNDIVIDDEKIIELLNMCINSGFNVIE